MLPASKVQRLLHELYGYYAIFIGVTSYRYDCNRQVYRNSKWTQLVASLANLFAFLILPMDIYYNFTQSYKLDKATILTLSLDTIVDDISCLLLVLQRFPRDKINLEFFQQLKRLQRIYRYRYRYRAKELEPRMEHIYLLKNCLIWVLSVLLICVAVKTFEELNRDLASHILIKVLVVFYALVLDNLDVTIHTHFMLTWHVCQLYNCLNSRIRELIKANDATVTLELHHMRWQHWQLTKLTQRLNATYNFTMVCSRFGLIVAATTLGYYLSVYEFQEYSMAHQSIAFTLYAVIGLDSYLLDLMYDMTKTSQRQTSLELRQLNELVNPVEQLSRGCELFVLQVACFPLEIKPYGLFASGKSTWLSNLGCILSWMIVLLQYRMVSEKGKLTFKQI